MTNSPNEEAEPVGNLEFPRPGVSLNHASRQTTGSEALKRSRVAADEEDDSDADMPQFAGVRIDRTTYLRMRQEYIARLRGVEPGKLFDVAARGRAIQQMEIQESWLDLAGDWVASNLGLTAAWTALGPAPILNGQTTTRTDPVSGRVTAIAVHPTNPNVAYLGTAQGGLWRTTDGGVSWLPLMDTAESLAIGAVTIDPLDPTKVFVGTGEGNFSLDSFFGVGLYRIDNADSAPVVHGPFEIRVPGTGTGAENGHAFLGTSITQIVVDPANDNRIFVGNTDGGGGVSGHGICCGSTEPPSAFVGLYFSANALAATPTFSRVSGAGFNGLQAVTDIVFEPGSSDNLLLGARDLSTAGLSGIYRMTDASTSSQSPSTAPQTTTLVLGTPATNIKFAINKVGSNVTVIAGTGEVDNPAGAGCASRDGLVRKSIDGGITWTTKLTAADGFCSPQCDYDIGLAIDPNDATKIYLGGSTEPNPGNTCSRLYVRSIDGGATFNTGVSIGLHVDVHAIGIAPNSTSRIYLGNDGGVWSSDDAGSTWTSRNTAELNTVQFQSLAIHPLDRNFTIGGTQDNGTNYQSSGGTWSRVRTGDGGFTLIDQNAADTTNVTMYHEFFNATNSLIAYEVTQSTGFSWSRRGCVGGNPAHGINCTDDVLFYAPMALGPGNPNSIYFGTDRLYRSSDRGLNHTVISQAPFSAGEVVSAIGISAVDDNIRIVGLTNGAVFATTTGANPIPQVEPGAGGSIPDKYIARAVIDPNNSNTAYVTLSGFGTTMHVWKTTNLNGSSPTWTNASGSGSTGIPDVPVNAFVIDPNDSNNLFAGTDIGVYNSIDGGATWSPFGTALPRAAVFDLAIQNPHRVLRAATHGRGMWEIALSAAATPTPTPTPTPTMVQFSAASYNLSEGEGNASISVTRTGDTAGTVAVDFATSDVSALQRFDYTLGAGTVTFAPGETTKTFSVLIVDDVYIEGSEVLNLTLSSPTGGAELGSPGVATLTLTDDDLSAPTTNPIDGARFFAQLHYFDFLARFPDAGGWDFWTGEITQCGADPACVRNKRIDVSNAFYYELEFQQTGSYVYRLYRAAFGNNQPFPNPIPDPNNPNEEKKVPLYLPFMRDRARVRGGSQLAQLQLALANAFVKRPEFLTKYPANLSTAAQFVDALLATIQSDIRDVNGGGIDLTSQRQALIDAFNQAGEANAGRGVVMYRLANDDLASGNGGINNRAFIDAEYNRAFVFTQYAGYLRRNPDMAGFLFWLNQVNRGPLRDGNTQHAMVCSFITSTEYQQRFSSMVTHTNAECPQ